MGAPRLPFGLTSKVPRQMLENVSGVVEGAIKVVGTEVKFVDDARGVHVLREVAQNGGDARRSSSQTGDARRARIGEPAAPPDEPMQPPIKGNALGGGKEFSARDERGMQVIGFAAVGAEQLVAVGADREVANKGEDRRNGLRDDGEHDDFSAHVDMLRDNNRVGKVGRTTTTIPLPRPEPQAERARPSPIPEGRRAELGSRARFAALKARTLDASEHVVTLGLVMGDARFLEVHALLGALRNCVPGDADRLATSTRVEVLDNNDAR